jgi:hypothetical protein
LAPTDALKNASWHDDEIEVLGALPGHDELLEVAPYPMARDGTTKQRATQPDALALDAELARITSLTIEQLRGRWRARLDLDPPPE